MNHRAELFAELERAFLDVRYHEDAMRRAEVSGWRIVDRMRKQGVAWMEILFAICRARGVPPGVAKGIRSAARKRLHDFRRRVTGRPKDSGT